jgi:hypothetical protein
MSLRETLDADLKEAMKSRDSLRRDPEQGDRGRGDRR